MADKIAAGYEKLPGRSPQNARAALDKAKANGFAEEEVRTTRDGYLIPYAEGDEPTPAEPVDEPTENGASGDDAPDIDGMKVAELDAFLDAHPDLDVDRSLNKNDKAAAIKAALESKE